MSFHLAKGRCEFHVEKMESIHQDENQRYEMFDNEGDHNSFHDSINESSQLGVCKKMKDTGNETQGLKRKDFI